MNKESFLTELAGHLRVLAEQEQQDILNEYAQHIDMKIKKECPRKRPSEISAR